MNRLTKIIGDNSIHSHEPTEYGNDLDRTDLLGEYEDLEEQGLLVKLPCKVDDEVIIVFNEYGELFITNGWIVTEITVIDSDAIFNFRCYETNDVEERSLNDFGKSVFLTREEAEKAIKKLEKILGNMRHIEENRYKKTYKPRVMTTEEWEG